MSLIKVGWRAFIPLPLVTGVVGGVTGAVGSIVGQVIGNGGFECFSWKNVGIAAGTGFAAGAAAPYVATTYLGAAALGGTANLAQYSATQVSNSQALTTSGAVASVASGIVGGVVAGPVTRGSVLPFNERSIHFPRGSARDLNNQTDIAANIATANVLRSTAAAVISNADSGVGACECRR